MEEEICFRKIEEPSDHTARPCASVDIAEAIGREQFLHHRPGTGADKYLMASRLHPQGKVDRVIVEWPDGLQESWTKLGADRSVTLERGTGARMVEPRISER